MVVNPAFMKYVHNVWLRNKGNYPSTGFMTLILALHICDQVSSFPCGLSHRLTHVSHFKGFNQSDKTTYSSVKIRTGLHPNWLHFEWLHVCRHSCKLKAAVSGFLLCPLPPFLFVVVDYSGRQWDKHGKAVVMVKMDWTILFFLTF